MKHLVETTVRVTKWSYITVLAIGLFFTSCEGIFEDIQEDVQPVVDFIEDITEIQEGLEDAMTMAEDALTITLEDGSTAYVVGECATVTHDELSRTLQIDFGTEQCEGLNGLERSGKITINYVSEWSLSDYSYSIEFENYVVNGNKIEGLLSVDMLHFNANGLPEFSETMQGAKITLSDGRWYAWDSERIRKMTSGFTTGNVMDDVYQITGSIEGTDHEGKNFSSEIKVPITFMRACWESGIIYPAKGRTRVEMTGKPATVIDWGLGFCDKRVDLLQYNKWLVLELN